ncbi:hypothetical protein PTE30175_01737 [Pandoraea terrae]|uniref:Uncharacterized protein n=1 Tax=Pandoraea terrae TaxID=1537710 RepID=A0A5E4U6G7_9BURK|nr:hypothetical protein [Pandoraea terrae]VVD94658.1 hypothetical protein PTE30175_01737 [Pandoraea terrae]
MDTGKTSLRSLIDKWLGPSPERQLGGTRFGRTANGVRYVSVEVLRMAGPLTIAFFRHEDGAWCVFPPRARQTCTTRI